jgi:F-type H+-transporting ATPase subunit a
MHFFSPLEQFEVNVLVPFSFLGLFDISFTNLVFYLLLSTFAYLFFMYSSYYRATLVPTRWQALWEFFYYFVLGMVKQQAGRQGKFLFPIFFFTFFFIFFSNLFGLFPLGFTPTGHIVITFTLALAFNVAFLIIGFSKNGLKFLKLFVPSGSPVWLLPLIVVIEVVSYLIRTFSLSLRLFANMMAGHTLLHILVSFVLAFINQKSILSIFAILPYALVFFIGILEFGIAFLQAYVFVILLSIYLNDALHPSH